MRAGRPRVVLDPYEWLPGHGGNRVVLSVDGGDAGVDVFYDGEDDDGRGDPVERCPSIRFLGACSTTMRAFPGWNAPRLE